MNSKEIRERFFEFFRKKGHKIVDSAPIVVKDDPTLMFTNAGMNQFKDFFLGTKDPDVKRIADTQKCLRVSGKHNDLEEVGRDSYHHTMFEMLGNWSFGDYFKAEAIEWAWELLTEEYGLPPERLYATVFRGDDSENLEADEEAASLWKNFLPDERILYFDKKDNFWEMGDSGPCGPCSEIHIDLRTDEERELKDGKELVNMDHPHVVEIWNLVFIQYNRMSNGQLVDLPSKHVDTGMGFERLCMALQKKVTNYDTDIFQPFIAFIEKESGIKYTGKYDDSSKSDIAMRVLADHVRAVSFTIADGELPSNTGAGYVIRRILRRAVRYYYSFLNVKEPFMHRLVGLLADRFADVFPELLAQQEFVTKVILEEEKSFLKTLEGGLKRIDQLDITEGKIDGRLAFELYDTYGFPIDLTMLIAEENSWTVDEEGFKEALDEQRERSRADAKRETGDWQLVNKGQEVVFVGYDDLSVNGVKILRYRILKEKDKEIYQVVLDKTPFYAEGGGQVGDTGVLTNENETIKVIDTKKENDLIISYVDKIPSDVAATFTAKVDEVKRSMTENNHTATHLLHAALRKVLGTHVHQKGSLVKDDYFRFDFSHFQKMTDEELKEVQRIVNSKIRENIPRKEDRSIAMEDAKRSGAMMLFGEKYGDNVRMITFDPGYSVELCGGCHVEATGDIGLFRIVSESAIAAGVRRIEAITADAAEAFINEHIDTLSEIKELVKNPSDVVKSVASILEENKALKKEIEELMVLKAQSIKGALIQGRETINGISVVRKKVEGLDSKALKTLAHNIEQEVGDGIVLLGIEEDGKAQLQMLVSKALTGKYHAGNMIRDLAKDIRGGGGGQPFYASAGGADPTGLATAIKRLEELL
jgi:alanyl-tRNA synthetase